METLKKFEVSRSGAVYIGEVVADRTDKGFAYISIPQNYYRDTRIWVNNRLIERKVVKKYGEEKELEFVKLPAELIETAKGSKVLKETPVKKDYVVVYVEEGYRGSSSIDSVESGRIAVYGESWASPRGNLGIGECSLIEIDSYPCKIHFSRDGRLYGGITEGTLIIEEDGNAYVACVDEPDPDIVDELNEE